jgi:hypothetical protein
MEGSNWNGQLPAMEEIKKMILRKGEIWKPDQMGI